MFWLAKYGQAVDFYGVKLLDATTKNYRANPTLATGDVKISKDGGAFANLATLPAVTPASGRSVKVSLSAAELQCKHADILFVDAAGSEWDDQSLVIHTYGDPAAKFAYDFDYAAVSLSNASRDQLIAGVWDELRSAHQVLGSFGEGMIVNDKTGFRLSSDGVNDILRTALTEGYAVDGGAPTLEQFMYMLFSVVAQFAISGTLISTKKMDGVTEAMQFVMNDALNPTNRTRTS